MAGTEPLASWRSGMDHNAVADLSRLLSKGAKAGLSKGSIDVVVKTILGREPLRDYVTRIGSSDRAERERMYQRLKRQRSRAMQRLRELLEMPPGPLPSGT